MAVPARQKRKPRSAAAQAKSATGMLRAAIERAGDEDQDEIKELLASLGVDLPSRTVPAPLPDDLTPDGVVLTEASDEPRPGPTVEDDMAAISQLEQLIKVRTKQADKEWTNADNENVQRNILSAKNSMLEMLPVLELAKEIAQQDGGRRLRKFGCRESRRLTVSGRYVIPDIKFRAHRYSTSNPVEIARLLHYIDNRSSGDYEIVEIDVDAEVLVSGNTGEFRGFFPGLSIEQIIKDGQGSFKRARP